MSRRKPETIEDLRPAAIAVLRRQLLEKGGMSAGALRAAMRVLEYTDGRPVETVEMRGMQAQPNVIVYVTQAATDGLLPGESIIEGEARQLPAFTPPSDAEAEAILGGR